MTNPKATVLSLACLRGSRRSALPRSIALLLAAGIVLPIIGVSRFSSGIVWIHISWPLFVRQNAVWWHCGGICGLVSVTGI